MTSFHVACFIADNGKVIFQLAEGDKKVLPLPLLGQLYGLYLFAHEHNSTLKSSVALAKEKIVWKKYSDSQGWSESLAQKKLDKVYQAIVLYTGLDCITNSDLEDKFTHDVKAAFPLIRLVMEPAGSLLCDFTNAVDIFIGMETSSLQTYLENFASVIQTPYACVAVHGRMAIWTTQWFELDVSELLLLNLLLGQPAHHCCSETPIFLPVTKPTEFYRMLTFRLVEGVSLCVICSDQPTFSTLLVEVQRFWQSAIATLRILASTYPDNTPPGVALDRNILGFVLVNLATGRSLSSLQSHSDDKSNKGQLDTRQRRVMLLSFYEHLAHVTQQSASDQTDANIVEVVHPSTESYVTYENCRCYALTVDKYKLLLLCSATLPHYALREVTRKTMDALTKNKTVQKLLC